MITKDTHKIDWNKTAHVTGVVLMIMAKGAWWVVRHVGIFLFAVLTVMVKVLVAILSVSASVPSSKPSNDFQQADEFERGFDTKGDIVYTGVRRKINF